MHTIDANTEQRKASEYARHGDRYYPVDESYDKRVYENDAANMVRIIFTLIGFWIFQSLHWWGVFCLGIVETDALTWYSLGAFGFTIIVGIILLISGKFANKKKRLYEFLNTKISEKKAAVPKRDEKPIHGLVSDKNFIVANAVENILAGKSSSALLPGEMASMPVKI